MPITVVCSCGQRLMADDRYAGRRAKCPKCDAAVMLPWFDPTLGFATASTIDTDFIPDFASGRPPVVGPDPDPAPEDPIPALTGLFAGAGVDPVAPTQEALTRGGPRPAAAEPWYYRIMTACAFVCVGLGVLQFAVVTIAALLLWSRIIDEAGLMGPFGLIGRSFLFLLLSLLVVAPMLLAVDVARSLRRIDANTSRGSQGR